MNNRQVAHLWANQSQERAKGSNFYFEGARLYSYGEHYLLGNLIPEHNTVLINSRGYSVTTAKHKNYAIVALNSSWKILHVPAPEASSKEEHAKNLEQLSLEYGVCFDKLPRARAMKYKTTAKDVKNGYKYIIAVGYCDLQSLLQFENPVAYTCGIYGWNFDVYEVGRVAIVTGYRGMRDKNIEHNYALIREYEQKAQGKTAQEKRALLEEFIQKAISG